MSKLNTTILIVGIIVVAIVVSTLFVLNVSKQPIQPLIQEKAKFQLTQDDIQITSVVNQNKDVACAHGTPSPYKNAWINGEISKSAFPNTGYDTMYNIIYDVYVDSNPNPYHEEYAYVTKSSNRFTLGVLGDPYGIGIPPESNHILNICTTIENAAEGITSNKICKQYQVAKLCD